MFLATGRNTVGMQYFERNTVIPARMERTKAVKLQNSVLLIWKNAIFFRAISLSSLQLLVPSPLWYHDMAFLRGKLPPRLCGKKISTGGLCRERDGSRCEETTKGDT